MTFTGGKNHWQIKELRNTNFDHHYQSVNKYRFFPPAFKKKNVVKEKGSWLPQVSLSVTCLMRLFDLTFSFLTLFFVIAERNYRMLLRAKIPNQV